MLRKTLALVAVCPWLLTSLVSCTPSPRTGEGKPAAAADKAGSAAVADKAAAAAGGKQAKAGPTGTPGSAKTSIPEVEAAQKKVNLEELPNSMVICTISGAPITVGDYRRQFKLQQMQLQTAVSTNLLSRQRVLEEAKKRGVKLTDLEKEKLLAAARGGRAAGSKEFKTFLAERKVSEEQFNKEVLDVGLALKTVNSILQQSLLNDMVNREILCGAARAARLETRAMNRYVAIKHSPTYDRLIKATGLSANELKDELVKTELVKLMAEKIQARAVVTDADIESFYRKNPQMFKHNERVRLSQIIVAAPTEDAGPIQSVKTQVKKAKPDLSEKEVEAMTTLTIDAQRRKAQEILAKAKSGANFAQLANELTDDLAARNAKIGGDLGYQERGQLVPQLADAIWQLKAGEVYPGLVQTSLGFHIVKVTAHEKPGQVPLAEVKEALRVGLRQQKNEQALAAWLKQRRQTTRIVLSPQFAAMIAAGESAGQTSSLALPH
ncbi:MAG TPA: peptidylprolyl isomerase [Candidatus Obscuribacterales bacterium]